MVRSQNKMMSRDLQRPFTSLACVAASTLELMPKSRSSKGPSYQASPTPKAMRTKPPNILHTRSLIRIIFPPVTLTMIEEREDFSRVPQRYCASLWEGIARHAAERRPPPTRVQHVFNTRDLVRKQSHLSLAFEEPASRERDPYLAVEVVRKVHAVTRRYALHDE